MLLDAKPSLAREHGTVCYAFKSHCRSVMIVSDIFTQAVISLPALALKKKVQKPFLHLKSSNKSLPIWSLKSKSSLLIQMSKHISAHELVFGMLRFDPKNKYLQAATGKPNSTAINSPFLNFAKSFFLHTCYIMSSVL